MVQVLINGQLVELGYRSVTETLKTSIGTVVSIVEHDFHLNSQSDPTQALSCEKETRTRTPAGVLLQKTIRTWTDVTISLPPGVHFVRLDHVEERSCDLYGVCKPQYTTYSYVTMTSMTSSTGTSD
jgi:hypothetical protein